MTASGPDSSAAGARGGTAPQAAATAAAGAAAVVLGAVVAGTTSGAGNPLALLGTALISPQLLVWLAGVGVLVLVFRRTSDLGFATLSLCSAPVASFVGFGATYGWPNLAAYPLLLVGLGWQSLGFAGAVLIGAISGVLYRRHRIAGPPTTDLPPSAAAAAESARERRRSVPGGLVLGLLLVGAALAFVLPLQWLEVYFALFGAPAEATAGDDARYLWTAGGALLFLIAALIAAIVRRRTGLVTLASLALVCALIGAFVFQVPMGRFIPDPAPADDGRDHPVCYGTTGDCPGG